MATGVIKALPSAVLREVPFAIAPSDWTLINGLYETEYISSYVTTYSKEIVMFDSSIRMYTSYDIFFEKSSGGGGITFSTSTIPLDNISGTIYVFSNDDGKLPVIIENTVVPIVNGGTGASSLSGAKTNLGIVPVSKTTEGLCPQLPDETTTTKYLRQDGTWVAPPNTTYSTVSKSAAGLCPQLPNETTTTKYLRQDGTWVKPPDNNTWRGFQTTAYSYKWSSTSSGATRNIKSSDFGFTTPSGYTAIGIVRFYSGDPGMAVIRCQYSTSSDTTVMTLKNVTDSSISSATASVTVLYLQSS